jgi:hypothetical protein
VSSNAIQNIMIVTNSNIVIEDIAPPLPEIFETSEWSSSEVEHRQQRVKRSSRNRNDEINEGLVVNEDFDEETYDEDEDDESDSDDTSEGSSNTDSNDSDDNDESNEHSSNTKDENDSTLTEK